MLFYQNRVCAGVGGNACSRKLSSVAKDPHPTCNTCRGKTCSRTDTCPVCARWDMDQWAMYERKKAYRPKKGGSVPVQGGGQAPSSTVAGSIPRPQQPIAAVVTAQGSVDPNTIFTTTPSNVMYQHGPMLSEVCSRQHRPMLPSADASQAIPGRTLPCP